MPPMPLVSVVLAGPPCSGKGFVADLLVRALGLTVVSTGELYRKEMESGSELGRRVRQILSDGSICPDDMTNAIVDRALAAELSDSESRVLLDGYPRTEEQLAHLLAHYEVGCYVLLDASFESRHRASASRGRWDDGDLFARRDATYSNVTAPMVSWIRTHRRPLSFNTLEGVDDSEAIARAVSEALAQGPIRDSDA